jgi:hypothetical protein
MKPETHADLAMSFWNAGTCCFQSHPHCSGWNW